jgi:hypothetical protein
MSESYPSSGKVLRSSMTRRSTSMVGVAMGCGCLFFVGPMALIATVSVFGLIDFEGERWVAGLFAVLLVIPSAFALYAIAYYGVHALRPAPYVRAFEGGLEVRMGKGALFVPWRHIVGISRGAPFKVLSGQSGRVGVTTSRSIDLALRVPPGYRVPPAFNAHQEDTPEGVALSGAHGSIGGDELHRRIVDAWNERRAQAQGRLVGLERC